MSDRVLVRSPNQADTTKPQVLENRFTNLKVNTNTYEVRVVLLYTPEYEIPSLLWKLCGIWPIQFNRQFGVHTRSPIWGARELQRFLLFLGNPFQHLNDFINSMPHTPE